MLRRELLKSLAGFVGLAVLPLAALVPKHAAGGAISREKLKALNYARMYGLSCLRSFPPGDYVIQTKKAESEMIVTTELRAGELCIVDVRRMA